MAIFYDEIPETHHEWIAKQKMFWVASAALNGLVNVSPKGYIDCFHIVNKNRVWYEDMTGSGIETISHMREPGNGRITIMFQAFEGAPRILRMWGTGTVYEFGTPEYEELIPPSGRLAGSRAVIMIDVHKVATSCGFGVPQYKYIGQRSQLERWNDKLERAEAQAPPTEKAPGGIKLWWTEQNLSSLDGLPGLEHAHETTLPLKNSYYPNKYAIPQEPQPEQVASKAPPSAKFFDTRVLLAFSLGIATTLATVMIAGLRGH